MKGQTALRIDVGVADEHTIVSRSGHLVDTSARVWILGEEESLSIEPFDVLPEPVREAAITYLRQEIRAKASATVARTGRYLQQCLTRPGPLNSIRSDIERRGEIGHGLFVKIRSALSETVSESTVRNYLSDFRRWYVWGVEEEIEIFDPDVALYLEGIIIGGNDRGEAVLSHDPHAGPLRRTEVDDFELALKRATAARSVDHQDLAIAWLFFSFGCNSKNLVWLNEEDIVATPLANGDTFYEIRLPRIKKRTRSYRSQFRTRPLAKHIAEVLLSLIADRKALADNDNIVTTGQPLFRREGARRSLIGTAFENERFRLSSNDVRDALKRLVEAIDVRAANGDLLHITPRRLRYTFATRLVNEGCPAAELADALDHSDTNTIMVYFNARLDAVEAIDAALASSALLPFAQKCGRIVRTEAEAVRGDDKASRIYRTDVDKRTRAGVGTCGSFSWCSLMAPVACYTCPNFQPWLDGPHQEVMDDLLAKRRKRLGDGADVKLTAINDPTIRAIAKVIERCGEIRQEAA